MADSQLSVPIPTSRLMSLASRYKNSDWLATFTREVKADAATNHTIAQIMHVVAGLNKTLYAVPGMETVGKEIALCLKPFIMAEKSEMSEEDEDDMVALFELTPTDIKVIDASSKETLANMSETAEQTRKKFDKVSHIDNSKTIFYMLLCLVRYSPKKKVIDMYYAYVYCRDTSVWQWMVDAGDKKKRMASLEVEGLHLLATALVRNSNKMVKAIPEEKGFEDLMRELS